MKPNIICKPCLLFFILINLAHFDAFSQNQDNLYDAEVKEKWQKRIVYEIFVQSFADSNGDGIGDIPGMTAKLDYLKELGVSAIWLMPIHPSPSYHKYDVTDYFDIHPDYGTLEDFKIFLKKAHQRDILVLMDLVINHCSREHSWFLEAKKDTSSIYRDYFIWADSTKINQINQQTRIEGDTYNAYQWRNAEGNKEKYYGFFSDHMPDLNYDNPKVREEVKKVAEFWLDEFEIDGFRLDGARHIFLDNRAKDNHQWWIEFKEALQKVKPDVYLVGEVWADAPFAAPFLAGIHSVFHFDLGEKIIQALNKQNPTDLIQNLIKTHKLYKSVNPNFLDATFLTNHDQNRVLSALGDDKDKAKLAASILFTLPGLPFIYYGEEIGMLGTKPDEQIREPFLWNKNKHAQTSWVEPQHSTLAHIKPLSDQLSDPNSIYTHYGRLIYIRNQNQVLSIGEIETKPLKNKVVCSFIRSTPQVEAWVLHNLSEKTQQFKRPDWGVPFNKLIFKTSPKAYYSKNKIYLPPYSSMIILK